MIPQRVYDPGSFVRASSSQAIEGRLRAIRTRMRRWDRWLTRHHPYNQDVLAALQLSFQQGDVDGPKMGEYIASSAPLHLADGWNYLSRAFDATCRGDRGGAYHLSYYAELRAAMSLLATEGIGIFNRRHIALDNNLAPTEFRKRTHDATWDALSAWSQETGRAVRLLQSISIESKSLSSWLTSVGVVSPAQQLIAEKWLNAWSVDLSVLSDDSMRRNEMSYRPTRIKVPTPPPVNSRAELADPIFAFWTELAPDVSGAKAGIDLSLLRQALVLVVDEGLCNYGTFEEALESIRQDMTDITYTALRDGRSSATVIFREAEITDFQGKPATPILARSLLMLRLASASTASLIRAAGISKDDLAFWWIPFGSDMGMWEDPEDYEAFADLWDDVSEAQDKANQSLASIRGTESVKSVSSILTKQMPLTQYSRALFWLIDVD